MTGRGARLAGVPTGCAWAGVSSWFDLNTLRASHVAFTFFSRASASGPQIAWPVTFASVKLR